MKSTFRWVATATSVLFLALAVVWTIAPSLLLWLWQIGTPDAALVVARRGAALYLGLGVILALIRDAEISPIRRAVTLGVAVTCAALAVLGLYDLSTGHAGAGIWLAIVTEIVVTVAMLVVSVA